MGVVKLLEIYLFNFVVWNKNTDVRKISTSDLFTYLDQIFIFCH